MTTDFSMGLPPEAPLDALTALAETSQLGKMKSPPRACPDGEGVFAEYESGLILQHPDLGAFPLPRGFAAVWKAGQASTQPLGYPVGVPTPISGHPRLWWQEFENGVLAGHPDSEILPVDALPLGQGSMSLETVTGIACEWLQRVATENPGCRITQPPECSSLLDFRLGQDTLAPRGHSFQFHAEYQTTLLPSLSIAVECDIRWAALPGTRAVRAWLDDYQYTVQGSRGLSWMLPQSTLDEKVRELVSPWLHLPQEVIQAGRELLCAKVFPDGALYVFPVPRL